MCVTKSIVIQSAESANHSIFPKTFLNLGIIVTLSLKMASKQQAICIELQIVRSVKGVDTLRISLHRHYCALPNQLKSRQ